MKEKTDMTKIEQLRKEKGWTQQELANESRVNIRQIQKFEGQERKIESASLRIALQIADALGVHPRELI